MYAEDVKKGTSEVSLEGYLSNLREFAALLVRIPILEDPAKKDEVMALYDEISRKASEVIRTLRKL